MSPEEAAIRINAFISSEKQSSRFTIDFANGVSEIVSGSHLIDDLNKFIEDIYPKGKILIISSPTLNELWGSKLKKTLKNCYSVDWCLIPDGEEYKNIESLSKIYDNAAGMKLDRESLVIGFGGGVIGDISGFAASTFMRGIPCIQIPTTLLSQTDSSIGGKTAINYKNGKNLIGSFYQPKMIIADTSLLVTLPPREFSNGLAEVIKYGIISDYEFFEYLENRIDKILKLDQEALAYIIRKSCNIKASIVQQDEMDHGPRMLLNYGHTIGHAIEAATDYRCFRHGEAVSLGMEGAAYIAAAMGIMNEDYRKRQSKLLVSAGLPIRFAEMNIEKVLSMMKNDKKSKEGRLRFVLSGSPGNSAIFDNVTDDCIKNALGYLKNMSQ
jgi:3-dehydroquinate synthase